ncbi:Uncharacterized protein RNJ44_04099 [Nakaseomyces bracarensis]|uniref:Peptide hydrolase n=1 Tax=Nakaseomyces bracarensis TaxID=273131 RepID=A0ABR4NTY3_9SACH
MKITTLFREIFRFRKTNFSIVLLVTAIIIAAITVFERLQYKFVLPSPSSNDIGHELLESAWLDLQHITSSFHPYGSRANDDVHDYILNRVESLIYGCDYVERWDDYVNNTNLLFKQPDVFNSSSKVSRVIYFESSNILVKVLGSDPDLSPILISAHFDSVPTSNGATDDGKGIATMLSLLQVYVKSQPNRTVIFNFNNNEEFGLLGAHAFMNHKWSKDVELFINLEGAGAGNRAILFRTSDTITAKLYKDAVKSQPFGNSIYQQAFYKRLVSSETDYKVYETNGLRGWDIAFYKPRDYYHTIKDSIKYTSKESLWSMLHTALQLANHIAYSDIEIGEEYMPSVYFDIFGSYFFVISAEQLFFINLTLLIIGPIIIFLKLWQSNGGRSKSNSLWVRLRFPFSCTVTLLLLQFLGTLINVGNPFIYSRNYLIPFVGLFCLFLFSNYAILAILEHLYPSDNFKGTAILQSFVLLWVILLTFTIKLKNSGYIYTGIYPISITTATYIFAILFGYFRSESNRNNDKDAVLVDTTQLRENISNNTFEGRDNNYEDRNNINEDRDNINEDRDNNENRVSNLEDNDGSDPVAVIDERAPLLRNSTESLNKKMSNKRAQGLQYDWFIQYFCLVPVSCYILFNCFLLALEALNQTVQEGSGASRIVNNIMILSVFFVALPILPFVYKVNYATGIFTLSVGLIFLGGSLIIQPFDELHPLKVRFSQSIDLMNASMPIVNLYTRKSFHIKNILSDLPSVKDTNAQVWCKDIDSNDGELCSYIGEYPQLLNQTSQKERKLLSTHILRDDRKNKDRSPYAPMTAELKIDAPENRVCSIIFDSGLGDRSTVKKITVFKSAKYANSTIERSLHLSEGINEFVIHKLDFDGSYHFSVEWFPKLLLKDYGSNDEGTNDSLKVKLKCYWGEYDTSSVVNGTMHRKVPAFDELLKYTPTEYIFTNRERGLVTVEDEIIL